METKETVIIDVQVQEQEAIASLALAKKSIVELKQQQAELNKEYKTGAKNLDEYAKESVQLEAALKKQQAQYSTIQRSVTGLKNPFDKLNESIKQQAQAVTVAGVSLSSFANPVTATIGILGGLFKAYSSSTIGAKDLEFATNQLSAATGILSNNLASLVSGAEDGEGFFTSILNSFLNYYSPVVGAVSKNLALIQEQLEDLGRAEISIRAENNERLEENAVILAKIADSTTDYAEKVHLVGEAILNLRKNEEALLKVKEDQLANLNKLLSADSSNENLQTAVLEKEKEISRIKSDTERKIQGIIKLESNLSDVETKRVEATRAADEAEAQSAEDAYYQRLKRLDDARIAEELAIEIANAEKLEKEQEVTNKIIGIGNARLEELKKLYGKDTQNYKKTSDDKVRIDKLEKQNNLNNAILAFDALAGLFEKNTVAYKLATLTKLTLDTASAISSLTAASEANPANALTFGGAGALQFAVGLIRIFSNIGQAGALISQAAGGGSFMTRGPQILLVGDNPGGVERVDVTPVSGRGQTRVTGNMVAMAGGGTMYTDGAIMAASRSMGSQNMMTPKVILTYEEFKDFQNSILFKESIATA